MSRITEVRGFVVKMDQSYLGGTAQVDLPGQRGDYVRHQKYRSSYSTKSETFLVRITTDDGTYGWGEAQAPLVPEVAATIVERLLGPFLLGRDPFDTQSIWMDNYDAMRERGHVNGYHLDAVAAIDIALWDLKGKLLGASVATLMGGRLRQQVPCYVSGLSAPDDDTRVASVTKWADQGFTEFKLPLGNGAAADARSFAAVRRALGDDATINVDLHWRYSVPDAITLGRRMEEHGLGFYEAPVAPEDSLGQAEVAAALAASVAIGEELRTRYDFRDRLVKRSADVLQPDVGRMGITEVMGVSALAEAFHVSLALHLGVGLGIYIAAGVQVAAATRNVQTMEFQPGQLNVGNALLKQPVECASGWYTVPEGPGLGVDVDLDTLQTHTTSSFALTETGQG
ncbi:mandelate racemase/muconate lactonizing enzyme family protein [Streptomyces sp. NPDC006967]|uniref:mandelate racemase/muconate lactonizing enzyme family protein n=1 Tax=unclassified Streptomyces TaxID=2593676 RepID=UPI000CD4EBC0|nr:mandelate racemase/muconate lactonizing enzyme family protein [Streptomyces sp. SM1]